MSKRVEQMQTIWLVGVRSARPRKNSQWDNAWQPTGAEWYRTRRDCNKEVKELNNAWNGDYQYKPLPFKVLRAAR